ncbi:unnamed protein product [Allacma fusca]|uniref:Dopa decarboxylase n=1 Tax=Allacma fusca TaxID=39272 RepID=A0A8J2LQC2_9HEXA|nr:unnamed protein product [Allacma fusca]
MPAHTWVTEANDVVDAFNIDPLYLKHESQGKAPDYRGRNDDDCAKLLKSINERGKIHIVPSKINGKYILRMAVCSRYTISEDMLYAYDEVSAATKELFG